MFLGQAIWRDIRRFEAAALPAINAAWNLAELGDQDMWAVLYRWDDAGRGLHNACSTELLDAEGRVLAASDSSDRTRYLRFVCEHRVPPSARLVILLALIPHVRPQLLDVLWSRNDATQRTVGGRDPRAASQS